MCNRDVPTIIVAALLAFTFGLIIGLRIAMDAVRADAIDAGVARWEVNPKTGASTFRFISK